MHGDEDGNSENSIKKRKETFSAIISIFESIKSSEDILDAKKSIVRSFLSSYSDSSSVSYLMLLTFLALMSYSSEHSLHFHES